MRLKTQKDDFIDLTEEEKKERWAEEVINNLTQKIPIMTSLAKKVQSADFHFIGLARHAALAESLIYKSKRFSTTSEVYRAAMYIGMSILYHLTKNEGTGEQKARAHQIYKTIQSMEKVNHNRQIVDAVVTSARDLIESADAGVIDYDEMTEKISTLVNVLPKELAQVANNKIKRVMKGENIIDIAETKMQPRGKKGMRMRNA